MADDRNVRQGFSLLTGLGILFALLLCMVSCAMVYVAIPSSSPLLRLVAGMESGPPIQSRGPEIMQETPTPFQPVIATPTATLEPVEATATPPPQPEPTQKPKPRKETPEEPAYPQEEPPASASVSGVKGSPQLYTLDCESQAAVDWARFFGTRISHQEFIDRLPRSDDPEEGFVGDVNGGMGQIPPNPYGVHAPPVASLLRDYGVSAFAVRDWDFKKVQHEIAAGRPVIVWIVNLPFEIETFQYTASNGNTSTVARFQHTWIITAYNASTVTVVDGQWTYNVRIPTFLERWEALGKQAIIYLPDI